MEFTLQSIQRNFDNRPLWGSNDVLKSAYPPTSHKTVLNMWVCHIDGGATNTDNTTATISTSGGGGTVELSFTDFESGFGIWTNGGGDCRLYTGGTYSFGGSNSANIQDNSGVASSFYLTNPIDLASPGYTQLDVEFYFYAVSMENGEDFWLQFYNGSSWQTVATFARGTDFDNNTFYTTTVTISEASYTFASNASLRFRCDASANRDDVYIDNITVTASSRTARTATTIVALSNDNSFRAGINDDLEDLSVSLYPNPAYDFINVQYAGDEESIGYIIDAKGSIVREVELNRDITRVSVQNLKQGIYMLQIKGESNQLIKFIKR